MKDTMKLAIAGFILAAVVGCTTGDKGATPADTATAQSTAIAPANTAGPVISAPTDTTMPAAPVSQPARPKSSGSTAPKSSTSSTTTTPPLRDSAFKPKATVDANGNIQPIKRDTLR